MKVQRRSLVVPAVATVALAVALALAGSARGIALYAYVLFLGALVLLVLARRIGAAFERTPRLEQAVRLHADGVDRVPQFESIARRLSSGRSSAFELHHRVRPIALQVAGAQLARRHGVDIAGTPERARELLGPRTWELVRPDREAPEERHGGGWSSRELHELVDELERQ